jgi:hypothetical protein
MIKVDVKVKCDKHLGMEEVACKVASLMKLHSQF